MPARKPWLAGLLGFLAPGLGQLYALRPGRAAAAFAASLLALPAAIAVTLLLPWRPWNVALGLAAPLGLTVAIVVDAVRVARVVPRDAARPRWDRWYVYAALIVANALAVRDPLAELVKRDLAEAFTIPSGSMEPTLLAGDYLYVTKPRPAAAAPRHGDVVVFESVEEPGLKAVKRVVGLPGDTLAMRDGALRRNGRALDEPYVQHLPISRIEAPEVLDRMRGWQLPAYAGADAAGYAPDLQTWGPIVVPADSLFLLGDNRNDAYDGRYFGFVPAASVIGLPHTVYFSYDPSTWQPLPALTAARWDRIGLRLR
jgi:signal peptidase I